MLKKKKLKQNYLIVPINMEMNRVNTEIKKNDFNCFHIRGDELK